MQKNSESVIGFLKDHLVDFIRICVTSEELQRMFDYEEDYTPIPLTTEILKKYGFEDENLELNGDLKGQTIQYGSAGVFYLYGQDSATLGQTFAVFCNHVHKFQNLYFALTGEELNFQPL